VPEFFLARQPIYDRGLNVYAYELLYRDQPGDAAQISDGDQATSQMLINTFLEMGAQAIAGDRPVFINLTRPFLTGVYPMPFDKRNLVLEVLEDIAVDASLVQAVKNLADEGYMIALDDFVYRPELESLIELAHVVKIDVQSVRGAALSEHVTRLARRRPRLLAEKVETPEDFDFCMQLGFELFQGYFFCRPRLVHGRRMPSSRVTALRLLNRLYSEDVGFDELEQIISQDVSLSFRFLRRINSAHYGLPRKISSLRQAMTLLGLKQIRSIVTLIALARFEDKPHELILVAMIRARMCERLAALARLGDPHSFFIVGLLSIIDALMDTPMAELVANLPLDDEINAALLNREGRLGEVLASVERYERGDWDSLALDHLSRQQISDTYLESLHWAMEAAADLK
jgi:EAL and modified HD-GYP domain-containing signal transduction protein